MTKQEWTEKKLNNMLKVLKNRPKQSVKTYGNYTPSKEVLELALEIAYLESL